MFAAVVGDAPSRRRVAVAATELRERLIAMGDSSAVHPGPTADGVAGDTVAAAWRRFRVAVAALPRGERRTRQLAQEWERAARMVYRNGVAEFAEPEDLGAGLLAGLSTGPCPRADLLRLQDANSHCMDLSTYRSADPPPRPAPETAPLVDQTELRWMLETEILRIGGVIALGFAGPRHRRAAKLFFPWLREQIDYLTEPRSVPALEELAAQWRRRRGDFTEDPEFADVIVVEPITRQRATWRWRLRHGDKPPPPA